MVASGKEEMMEGEKAVVGLTPQRSRDMVPPLPF